MTSKYILIDTNNLYSGNNSSGKINVYELTKGEYRLDYFCMTNNLYNVNDTNNNIKINYFDGILFTNYNITLTNGNYSANDLATHLDTQLTASVGSWTVSYSNISGKFTITETTGGAETFVFLFGDIENDASTLLGFSDSNQTSYSNTQTSDNPIQLNTYKNIYIKFSESDEYNIRGNNYFTASFFIPIDKEFGEKVIYKVNDETFGQVVKLDATKSIEFKFLDINKKSIDINNAHWQMILKNVN